MKLSYGNKTKRLSAFPQNIVKLKAFIESNFEE